MKKILSLLLAGLFLTFSTPLCAQETIAQTLNIYTKFKSIVDKPTWLLEIRDIQSGQVLPYVFDIRKENNFWVAFSKEHNYRIVGSVLKFGPYATINNFCGLEDGMLSGKSMFITIKGVLSPNPADTKCYVTKFKQQQFFIATPAEEQ